MKALIISDKPEIVGSVSSFLKDNGFDIIVYRWLLKALDNIEEIQPDLIFLSAAEYPRHWKTLASYVQSGIGGSNVKIYLYEPEALPEDEEKKVVQLGIEGVVTGLMPDDLAKVVGIGDQETAAIPETLEGQADAEGARGMGQAASVEQIVVEDEIKPVSYQVIFTDPLIGRFIFGTALLESGNYLCDFTLEGLCQNQTIKYVSVYDEIAGELKSFSASVVDNADSKITLKVEKYYGEES